MPETSRRPGRGQRNGSEAFGHGRPSDRSSLRRRFSSPEPSQRRPLPESADGLGELDTTFWETLDDGLRTVELTLDAAARTAIDGHVRLLLAWNESINLTALRQPEQIARNHVLDSLIAAPTIVALAGPAATLIDLGSGAGFPGVPLSVCVRAKRAAFVDSIGKKARFLDAVARHVTRALDHAKDEPAFEALALAERAEDLADEADHRERWDIVTARAVGDLAEVAELGLPLARVGGHVVAWKSESVDRPLEREVREAARVCQAAGGGQPRIVRLPAAEAVGLAGHCLVIISKRRPTPDRYPRQPGERRRPR